MNSIIVVGGSDAGISAALRARELAPQAVVSMVVADQFPNYSICGLPFYLSGEVEHWQRLAHRSREEIEAAGIRLHLDTRVVAIDPVRHQVMVEQTDHGRATWSYDRLVIATGAKPIRPPIAGIDLPGVFDLHTMQGGLALAQYLDARSVRSAVIIGAGYIGLEMADALIRRGIVGVTVLEQKNAVLPTVDEEFGRRLGAYLGQQGVRAESGVQVTEIERHGDGLRVLGRPSFSIDADLVLVVVGVEPNTELGIRAGVAQGVRGALRVDREMATNLPDVYAAGDCAETYHRLGQDPVYLPLGTTAHKQGRIAGANVTGGHERYAGSLGTQVVKLFERAVARTGWRDEEAKTAGRTPLTVQSTHWDHKGYYPGAHPLHVRVTGDVADGRLLGAQILGHWQSSVAKRIDIFAAALFQGLKVADLLDIDLSYTPPFGSPWDPVQLAAEAWEKASRAD